MTETKHTPGPWRVEARRPTIVEREVDASTVASCHDFSRARHDALLIAAAPAMLEALEEIVGGYADTNDPCRTLALARRAIAAARGEVSE